ncbi:MAG: ATP-binding protein [Rhizobiaceae bacterium]|nr:ATP-binding protein [Rhizobiaceae bacterium]
MTRKISNPPDARALMNGARSIGNYDLAAALADLIDNSITAKASGIDILCRYMDGKPLVTIKDNGLGMSQEELTHAMRPASCDPERDRDINDLGRFGWGMKSASFSQAKVLTVISKHSSGYSGAKWDLDDIAEWNMDVFDSDEAKDILEAAEVEIISKTGTVIIWENCDRLMDGGEIQAASFNSIIAEAREKLAIIYHRYLSPKFPRRILLKLNGIEIESNDPFFSSHPATQPLSIENITIKPYGDMTVQPFILPHFSKLKRDQISDMEGAEGINRNQGFYVYRNDRLIIHGTWFGILKHGDLSDLVRVKVDIPNSMDKFWKISIDKNNAKLPISLKTRLKEILQPVTLKSVKVYRNRGGMVNKVTNDPVWISLKKSGIRKYEINTNMSVINAFENNLNTELKAQFKSVLSLLQQALPIEAMRSDLDNETSIFVQETTNQTQALDDLKQMVEIVWSNFSGTKTELLSKLLITDFFKNKRVSLEEIVKDLK